jgi:hypothetical protein
VAIDAGSSVAVAGTVGGLGANTLWLLTKPDAGGGSYYFTEQSPVATQDGRWTFPDTGVGDNSDKGRNIAYLAIVANDTCSSTLTQAPDDTIDSLPAGCSIAAAVSIHVNK